MLENKIPTHNLCQQKSNSKDIIGTTTLLCVHKQRLRKGHKVHNYIWKVRVQGAQLQYLDHALDGIRPLSFTTLAHLFAAIEQAFPQTLVHVKEVAVVRLGQVFDKDVQE